MRRTAAGSSELREIVEKHGPAVFSLALRVSGDRSVAEEITQDVFMELWRAQPEFASEEHRRYWLRRVATHRATDYLRRRMRRPALVTAEWLEEEPKAVDPGLPPYELKSRLEGLLQSLPDAMRAALVLRYGEDEMPPEEIARLLGRPVATVKSNLQRALALLRRKAGTTLKEFVRNG